MPKFQGSWLAWAALALIWGCTFILMKLSLARVSPLQLVFIRTIFGLLPVLCYSLYRRDLGVTDLRHAHHFLVMALFAGVFYFFGFARGVALLPSGIAGAVTAVIPIVSATIAWAVLPEEKATLSLSLGLIAGFAGVLVLALPFEADYQNASLFGVLWMLAGCCSLGASFVYAKKFLSPLGMPGAKIVTYQLGIATLLLAVLVDLPSVFDALTESQNLLVTGIGLGVIGTGFAYILYYRIVDDLGAVRASAVTYVSPVVALIIGSLFVGENIGIVHVLATLLIMVGVIFVGHSQLLRPEDGD